MLLFLISILLLAVSLLALIPAPTYHLWMLAVAVTEFPLIFLLASVIIAVISRWLPNYRVATLICCLAAFIVFASPVVRAWMQSRPLVTQLDKYFPDTRTREKPFSILRMLPGQGEGALPFKTYEYTQNASGALTLDHYPSQLPGIRPCVVIIHGGSWQSGDSRQLPELNSWLAARGYHAFAINYRKAPGFKSPAAVEDALDAVAWIRQRAAALHADTNNFVLLGRSAGAQIALVAAYSSHDPAIRGVVSFYGPADMVWGYSLPANPWVMDSRKVMVDYLGGTYDEVPNLYAQSSATESVHPAAPPTLMIHGQNDVLVAYEHNSRLIRKLDSLQRPNFLLTLPWATHGCDYTLNGPSGQLITYTLERYLKWVLKG